MSRNADRLSVAHEQGRKDASSRLGAFRSPDERERRGHRRPPARDRLLELATGCGHHRPGLDEAFLELAGGTRVGHHAAAGAEPDPLAAQLQRAYGDVELEAA